MRRRRGEANYRLVRYADDFVIVVAGERWHAEALVAEVEQVIAPLGLALSKEKTGIAHIDEGIEFLGWKIRRQPGRNGRPQIYTYPSQRSLQAVVGKVKQITRTGYDQTLDQLLHRLNPVLRGWCAYFRHGVSSRTFGYLRAYVWRRVTIWLRHKHHRRNWRWLKRRYLPGWWPTAETVGLYNPAGVKTTRYRYRGGKIPTPWEQPEYEQLAFDLERLEALIAR
jgi:RNA-directed DNA polymerase